MREVRFADGQSVAARGVLAVFLPAARDTAALSALLEVEPVFGPDRQPSGAAAAVVTALEARLPVRWAGRLRRAWTLAHILVLAPFPVLLGFHVLKVYYF